MGKHEKERDGFKSRTGFILACIGSAVGMGNIWRFPYMVSDWGGMTFPLVFRQRASVLHNTVYYHPFHSYTSWKTEGLVLSGT